MKKDHSKPGSGAGKTFAVRPFSAIKGIVVDPAPAAAKPVAMPVQTEKPGSQAEDDLLFLTEMAGVARIQSAANIRRSQSVKALQEGPLSTPEPEESRIFLDALKQMKLDVSFADASYRDDEPVTPRKVSRMRQLRRGTIRLNLEIDLHDLTREEAVEALGLFISAAGRRGQQAVLVITGKGVHSSGEPVIKAAVADWLAGEGRKWVAEFMPAPQNMGGDGAYVVFLKALKPES